MAYLLLSRDNNAVLRFPLDQERITVGRDEDCDLTLDDSAISRQHFELTWDGQGYTLTDYSRNGTFVEGERVADDCSLLSGQKIAVGPYTLEYVEGSPTAAATTVDTQYQPTLILKYEPDAQELSIEKLHFSLESNGTTRDYVIDRLPMSIGGSAQNAITIEHDPYISRTHCIIEHSEQGLVLKDCDSRNGTWWGNTQITSHILPERGKFQIGNTEIAYHVEIVKERIAPAGQQRFGEMLGSSQAMQRIFALIAKVAPSHATVLIQGESGTGKELLARALHAASGRAHCPFVALNCGALPASVIESELFGHERGAFTGANNQHKGVFEQAHGGTIFLDEVGEMSLELQTHLLRVLESRSVRRVGGTSEIDIDVRVIAATNRDLSECVSKGTFREDLFYRLCIVPMHIPPLRKRPEDIALLANHFVQVLGTPQRSPTLTKDAQRALQDYAWPGNARELRHTIERSLLMSSGSTIDASDIIFTPHSIKDDTTPGGAQRLQDNERNVIEDALRTHRGNISNVAKILGISRSTLTAKVKRFEIDVQQYRGI